MYTLLIKNARIVDGTGAPGYRGDIAVKGDAIERIAPQISEPANRIIDAQGLTATPGWVDIHRHGDLSPIHHRGEGEEIRQGITTFVNGNCGFSAFPSTWENFSLLQDYAAPILDKIPEQFAGMDFTQFTQEILKHGFTSNMGFLVGNGSLRIAVKGFDDSPLTKDEMQKLKAMLDSALRQGAMGLSMGLMYIAERYLVFNELCEIASVVKSHGKPIFVHMRGEGGSLVNAVSEVIALARSTGASFHISHLKAAGKSNWGKLIDQALEMIGAAVKEGLDVSFDVYPYDACSTAMYTLLPPWVQVGGMEEMTRRLTDPDISRKIIEELGRESGDWDNLAVSTGWDKVAIAGGNDESIIGKSILDYALENGTCAEQACIDLIARNRGDIPIVFYCMDEQDVQKILSQPDTVIISDAIYSPSGTPHPRRYGAFGKAIRDYSELLGFERAVKAMTLLPARAVGITDRGVLQKGKKADILLLDEKKYSDTATYIQPESYPTGIKYTIINGVISIDDGKLLHGCHGKRLISE